MSLGWSTARVREALSRGVVLVFSLWGTPALDDGMRWLDGGCSPPAGAYPHCDLDEARAVLSDLTITNITTATAAAAARCQGWCNAYTATAAACTGCTAKPSNARSL